MPVAVFVIGMHRSGTSAATRLLNLLGLSLGDPTELLPPGEDNPTGFWENAPLMRMNDELLALRGAAWDAPPESVHGWQELPSLDEIRARSRHVLLEVMPADRDWLWKDPRNCLTLPFWLELINRPVAAVLIHRNPLEVAASLARRDGFAPALSLALWEHYLRCSLVAIAGVPTLVTSFESLLTDPVGWCGQARGFLASLGAQVSSPDPREISAFVQPALRHTAYSSSDLLGDQTVSPSQQALYELLGALEGGHETFAAPDLPLPTPWVKPLLEERRRRTALERELIETRKSLASVRGPFDHQRRALDLALEEGEALGR